MRNAHFCAEGAEEEWRGVGGEFNDVVQRRRGGRAVLVAALLLAEPPDAPYARCRVVAYLANASVTRPQDSTLAPRPDQACASGLGETLARRVEAGVSKPRRPAPAWNELEQLSRREAREPSGCHPSMRSRSARSGRHRPRRF